MVVMNLEADSKGRGFPHQLAGERVQMEECD